MQPIDEYLERSLWMEEDEFCDAVPAGVLLCEPDAPAVDPLGLPPTPTRYSHLSQTGDAEMPAHLKGAKTPGNEVFFVYAIVKRPGVPHADRVLIGRTEHNDIVVPHMAVSRSHAWVTIGGADPELVDAGSKHGTFVGEKQLAPNLPVKLVPGRRLRFGDVQMLYLSGIRFFHYCQARTIADHAQRTIDGATAKSGR